MISIIGRETFGHLGLALKAIMQNILRLPPVTQKSVFMRPSKGSYRSFNEWLWEKFQLHELVEIVRHSSDPDFAQLLNRVREGQQTNNDVIQIKTLANTDTATCSDEFVKVYLNNYLAGQENEDCISKLDFEVIVIKAQDSNKYIETNACSISIPEYVGFSQISNLPAKLKLSVGATVMLTDNISVTDRLINGSIDTVKHIDRRPKLLCSTIHVKFDDPKAGNSLKDRRFHGELKGCVPITARAKRFPLKKGKCAVIAERKQFPLILGHAITVHKSQGSTLAYMQGDLNRFNGKKTATGKNYQQLVSQGQFYTLLCQKL